MTASYGDFRVTRLGTVLRPEHDDEKGGVMNPTCFSDPDGKRVMIYRKVNPKGRSSALGIAVWNETAQAFMRNGDALRPKAAYEKNGRDGGEGCEDARVVWVEQLRCFVMLYTAYGPLGPRIAAARSDDGYTWERLGLVDFPHHPHIRDMDNKNSCMLPEPVISPSERLCFAFIHRPRQRMAPDGKNDVEVLLRRKPEDRPGIWIAYVDMESVLRDIRNLLLVQETMQIITPDQVPWKTEEQIQIGGGSQFIPVNGGGLMTFYHGVYVDSSRGVLPDTGRYDLSHWGGIAIVDKKRPHRLRYMGPEPVLTPQTPEEIGAGRYRNIAFPTAIERSDGSTNQVRMYYGCADTLIANADVEFSISLN